MTTTFIASIIAATDDTYTWTDGSSNWITEGVGVGKWKEFSYSSSLRFTNVTIPSNSIIHSANITFTSAWTEQGLNVKSKLLAEITGNPEAINSYADFWDRANGSRTTAETLWDIQAPWINNTSYVSPDLTDVIQEVIGGEDWASGNSMNFFWLDNGSAKDTSDVESNRGAHCFESDVAKVPVLTIVYEVIIPGVVDKQISENGDDGSVSRSISPAGVFTLDSTTLKTGIDTTGNVWHDCFFRFQNVVIPQYAQVTNATLTITVSASGENTAPPAWLVVGADANGNSPQIASALDFVSRGIVDSWNFAKMDAIWSAGSDTEYVFPNIWSVVQELVDRPDWVSGNAMQFFLLYWAEGTQSWRGLYSYENDPTKSCKLHIEYDDPLPTGEIDRKIQTPLGDVCRAYDFGPSDCYQVYSMFENMPLGQSSNKTNQAYVKFQNVRIPKTSRITSATLLIPSGTSSNSVGMKLRLQAEDADSSTWIQSAADFDSVPKTTAYVDWNFDTAWIEGTYYDAPDISSLIQEVIDRDNWVDGNEIGIFILDNGTPNESLRYIGAYEKDALTSVNLLITFESPATFLLQSSITSTYDDGVCVEKLGPTVSNPHTYITNYYYLTFGKQAATDVGTHVNLRFQNINVPKGAIIKGAYLTLWPYFDNSTTGWKIKIIADKQSNSTRISTAPDFVDRITNRKTTSYIEWTMSDPWTWDPLIPKSSPNFSEIIQEIIDMSDWVSGNSIQLFLVNLGTTVDEIREVTSFRSSGNQYQPAQLSIYYDAETPPTFRLLSGPDDCMSWTNTDPSKNGFSDIGNVLMCGNKGSKYSAGFRFEGVSIPQGSTVTNAYLTFTAKGGEQSEGIDVKTIFYGEPENDTLAIKSYEDYKNRTRTTTSVSWNIVGSWLADNTYNSGDISSIIQEYINLPGWASGDSLMLFWECDPACATGNIRSAYSYEGDIKKSVTLSVSYTEELLPWKQWLNDEMIPQQEKELSSLNQSVTAVDEQKTKWQHWKGIYEGIQGEAKTNLEARLANKVTGFEEMYFPSGTYDSITIVYGGTYNVSNITDWEIHGILSAPPADDVLYVYEGTGWDNDSTIKKAAADWLTMYPLIQNSTWGASKMVTYLTTAQGIVTPWKSAVSSRNPILKDYKD